jgi:hypothetical protein
VGEALPYDPEDKPDPAAPRPVFERADWLVGADDGLQAELARPEGGEVAPGDAPRLVRPVDSDAGTPQASRYTSPFSGRSPLAPPAAAAPAAPAMPSWEAGNNSVPLMRRSASAAPSTSPSIPELARDFPMDDADERARIAAQMAEDQAREALIAARPHAVVQPQEFDLPTVPLPWWSQVPNLMRLDRRVQLVALVAVLALVLFAAWPRAEKTISVAHLKEHPEQYADTQVRVGGQVSEVFKVGGSWAYTLVQARDTIVVFSRTREPKPRERIVVVGMLSNGYLDGQSRVAIFEATR